VNDEEYLRRLEEDPGDPLFAQFADKLREEQRYHEAMDICFQGLSSNPSCHRGRLVLARVFYERMFWPFAVRELRILMQAVPDNAHIAKIIERLAPGEDTSDVSVVEKRVGDTVAETEFDMSDIELMEEE
jgi:lipopolysaccharide biosynthesis regulator YciM